MFLASTLLLLVGMTVSECSVYNLNVPGALDENRAQERIVDRHLVLDSRGGRLVGKLNIKIDGKLTSGCAGTLISPYYVLTAASCFPANLKRVTEVEVILGVLNLIRCEPGRITRYSREIKRSNFNPDSDVALIRLGWPVDFNSFPQAAEGDWDEGRMGYVIGWGLGSPGKGALRIISPPFLNDSECSQAYGSQYQSEVMLCAGNLYDSSDICTGYKGAPLYKGEFMVGITLRGMCGARGYPRMYTKLSGYMRWIKRNSADEGSDNTEVQDFTED